jgi:hypothetical protein
MKHSRPGYAPRSSEETPAKLNADMIPAIHRKQQPQTSTLKQPSEELLNARAEAAMGKLAKEHPPVELIVNPTPSVAPQVLEPGK